MTHTPDILPILSAGKHRSPRSGGCFMEIASYLAGERWSDHPRCTDPALAELARCVNDRVPDAVRPQLAILIPAVIGTGYRRDHERVILAAAVVRSCTSVALRTTSTTSLTMACALLMAESIMNEARPEAAVVLGARPGLEVRAERFMAGAGPGFAPSRRYLRSAVPQTIRSTVCAVSDELGAEAAAPVLTQMLSDAIFVVRDRCGLERLGARVSDTRWGDACSLVGITSR